MNKIDILNQILNNLNRLNVNGIANMKLVMDSVNGLELLGQIIAKEEQDRNEAAEPEIKVEPVTEEN